MPALRYYRKPGQSVNYSPLATAKYISRNARWQRGLRLRASSYRAITDGYEFKFLSPRGPRATQGAWLVTATTNPGGGGGGGGGDPGNGAYDSGQGPVPGGQCSDVRYFIFGRASYRESGRLVVITMGTVSSWFGPVGPMQWTAGNNVIPEFNPLGKWYVHMWVTVPGGEPGRRQTMNGIFGGWVETPHITAITTDLSGGDPLACGSLPWAGSGGGGGGGGGGGDSGGNGKYVYSCTCPDFSKVEGPKLAARFPSDFKLRNWASSNAGAQGSPRFCKHIVSSAYRLGDTGFFGDSSFLNDIPPTEFYYSRQDALAQRLAADSAARQALLNSSDGYWARLSRQRALERAARSQQRLSQSLNSFNRYSEIDPLRYRAGETDFTYRQADSASIQGGQTTYLRRRFLQSQIGSGSFSTDDFLTEFNRANRLSDYY